MAGCDFWGAPLAIFVLCGAVIGGTDRVLQSVLPFRPATLLYDSQTGRLTTGSYALCTLAGASFLILCGVLPKSFQTTFSASTPSATFYPPIDSTLSLSPLHSGVESSLGACLVSPAGSPAAFRP